MQRSFLIPVGENAPNLTLPSPYQIAGIRVDNPSGSWLRLMPINEYVPPWREAWTVPVVPNAATVSLEFTDSQSGSLSTLVGNPVSVFLYDTPLPASDGRPSGSGSRQATIPPSLTAQAAVPTGSTSTLISMLNNPNQRIVIRRLGVTPDLTAGLGAPIPFGSLVTVLFELSGGGSGTPRWYLSISPESPFAEATFEDGVFTLPAGIDFDITPIVENGAGKAYVIGLAQYYLEEAV